MAINWRVHRADPDAPLCNFTATTDPTTTDDTSSGYAVGSRWVNTSTDEHFVCADATANAAVWLRTSNEPTSSTSNPGVNNDTTQGYVRGDLWVNTTTSEVFICLNPATGAAVWREVALSTGGMHVDTTDPTVNDDVDSGYDVGELWLNTVTARSFICLDSTAGAAVWNVLSVKKNLAATTDPTVNDDIDEDYAVGSIWINTTSDEAFICVDNSDGAAVWYSITALEACTATDGAAAPASALMVSGKVDDTIPAAEDDGDHGAFFIDPRRRLVIRGADLTSYTIDINDVDPALARKYGPHDWPQLTAPGVTNSFNVENWRNIIVAITFASIDTDAVVQAEGSMDDTDFFPIAARDNSITGWAISGAQGTATVDATYALHLMPVAMKFLRFRFVSEDGGTAVTIDASAFCGN